MAFDIQQHLERYGPATHLAVFYVLLPRLLLIDQYLDGFTTVRTTNFLLDQRPHGFMLELAQKSSSAALTDISAQRDNCATAVHCAPSAGSICSRRVFFIHPTLADGGQTCCPRYQLPERYTRTRQSILLASVCVRHWALHAILLPRNPDS